MKIVILPLYGIGDTLMSTPAIEILKKSIDCWITNICMFKSTYEILKENPFIDELIYFPFMEKTKFQSFKFVMSLRGRFDCAINFYPSNRWQYNLINWLTGAKKRIGHRYIKRDIGELNFLKNYTVKESEELHNVEENIRLLKFFGINANDTPPMRIYFKEEEIESGKRTVQTFSSRDIKIGIHTGTSSFKGHRERRLPVQKFLELINSMPDIDFFLFGTDEEKQENEFISKNAKYGNVILIQNKPIRMVASIIKQMNAFVSNDSGLMHLAAAVGIPVVAIFGPTNPVWVRPWKVKHKIVRIELPCSPCFYYSPKPLKCVAGLDFKCLKEIESSNIRDELSKILY